MKRETKLCLKGRTDAKDNAARIFDRDGTIGAAKADPVPLSSYADANGFIDVQALTCGQLANTYQEDANALTSWYSGWYNGLAHKHFADFKKGREVEHQVIEYCKAHPDERIIHAIGLMLREDRAEGMMMEK
jgi:hypothetical protein